VTSTNHIPDKAELYRLVLERGIIESASDHVKRLWAFLFVEFKILEVPDKVNLLNAVRTSIHSEFATLIEDVIMVPFDRQRIIAILLRTKEQEVLQF
jgi:hypothetical protein